MGKLTKPQESVTSSSVSATTADEKAIAISFSTTLILGQKEIPLVSGPINLSDLKDLKGKEVTEKLQEWIKNQTFQFPSGYEYKWSVTELVEWLTKQTGGVDPLPAELQKVFSQEITITDCSASGNGTFSISFLVTFKPGDGTVNLDGFPLGVKNVGFSVVRDVTS